MNTVQHEKKTITRHELRMSGPINARDIGDFVNQVNRMFVDITGRPVQYDDDYTVVGDEDGLTASFETEEEE